MIFENNYGGRVLNIFGSVYPEYTGFDVDGGYRRPAAAAGDPSIAKRSTSAHNNQGAGGQ